MEVKQREKELLTDFPLDFMQSKQAISFRVQNSAVVGSVTNFKLINSEAQENKAHHYGIHYYSGRAKPVRFILQRA